MVECIFFPAIRTAASASIPGVTFRPVLTRISRIPGSNRKPSASLRYSAGSPLKLCELIFSGLIFLRLIMAQLRKNETCIWRDRRRGTAGRPSSLVARYGDLAGAAADFDLVSVGRCRVTGRFEADGAAYGTKALVVEGQLARAAADLEAHRHIARPAEPEVAGTAGDPKLDGSVRRGQLQVDLVEAAMHVDAGQAAIAEVGIPTRDAAPDVDKP